LGEFGENIYEEFGWGWINFLMCIKHPRF
jgi:hypothetical protein